MPPAPINKAPSIPPEERQRMAIFLGGVAVLCAIWFFGIALRVSINNDIDIVARGGISRVLTAGIRDFFDTAFLLAGATAAYGACLWALHKGFRHSFAATIAATVLACLSIMPAMPLTSPDAVHLAADVRTFWLHHKNPTNFRGAPGKIDDPVANEVRTYRDNPSGYGPVAYIIGGAPIPFVGDSFRANLVGQKVVAATFLVLTALFAGFIARRLGQNPALVAGLIGLNPLMIWQYPGDGHNDTIMAFFGMLALFFLIRPGWRDRGIGIASAGASVLSKLGLFFASPVVTAWLFPRFRFAIAAAWILLGGVAVTLFATQKLPYVNGTLGPAGAIALTTPWGVLADALNTGGDANRHLVAIGYFLYLGIAAVIVTQHPLETAEDFIRAVALAMFLFLFACSPGYLAWYQVWYLPFAALSRSRLHIATMLMFSVGAFFPILAANWNGSIPQQLSINDPVQKAVIVTWVLTGLVAFLAWRLPARGGSVRRGKATETGPRFAPRAKKARA
jgi:hypothetical protein